MKHIASFMIGLANILPRKDSTKWCLFLVLLFAGNVMAQTEKMSVASFHMLDGDLTARINPVKNNNDLTCALIKIVTTEKGFVFEPDAMGVCESRDTTVGEIWLFVAPGSQRITIKHPQLGVLRNYFYPVEIKAACTYEMVLTTAEIHSIIVDKLKSNYLSMTINQPDAVIIIDGKMVVATNGQISKMYDLGEHKYEVSCKKYHTETGSFKINADSTTIVNINLKPNFGNLKIMTLPKNGASVFIDNERQGTTPYQANEMISQTYRVRVIKDMYLPVDTIVEIIDNQTSTITLTLQPDFANPTLECLDPEAEIWINDTYKSKGKWSGQLSAGVYKVEARRNSHQTSIKSITLKNGDNQLITIPSPIPITGRLNVNSMPLNADIILNGKNYGKTPKIITDLLVGDYTLRIEKQGCSAFTQKVVIEKNATEEINVQLSTGKRVHITSKPSGATVTIDGTYQGITPLQEDLSFGQHTIDVEIYGGKKTKAITITENADTNIVFDVSPNLEVSPSQYRFSKEAGQATFKVTTKVDNWEVTGEQDWFSITREPNSFSVTTKSNNTYNQRNGVITVSAANKEKSITLVQLAKIRKTTDDFSDYFLEIVGGYQTKAKSATLGVNFSYIGDFWGGHLGFYLNPNYGFDNSFIGSAGVVTRLTHSNGNPLDFQLFGGVAYKTPSQLGIDAGIRLTGNPDGYDLSLWSATIGTKIFKDEIIPSIGISTGVFGTRIFADGRVSEEVTNYPLFFAEPIAAYGFNANRYFWGVGAQLAWVPSTLGLYVKGLGGDGWSAGGGAVFRIFPEDLYFDLDWQLYAGAAYHSSATDNLVLDAGFRFSGVQDRAFGLWSATVGTMFSLKGEVYPTLGLSTGCFGGKIFERIGETTDDYSQFFLDYIGSVGINGGWGVGLSFAYVPSSVGVYASVLGGEGLAACGGPVFRVLDEYYTSFDLQLYTGVGYHSLANSNFVFDLGLRFTGASDIWWPFSLFSATVGTMVSLDGEVYPTFGLSFGITTIYGLWSVIQAGAAVYGYGWLYGDGFVYPY